MIRQRFSILVACLLLTRAFSVFGQDSLTRAPELDPYGFGHPAPLHLDSLPEIRCWATYYLVHVADFSDSGHALLRIDSSGTGAQLDLCDWCSAAIEGTVATTDSAGNALLLNYAGKAGAEQVDCSHCERYRNYPNKGIRSTRWDTARGPFGDGVEGYQLVPYRSIAVDPKQIPIGSLVYIPAAVGSIVHHSDSTTSLHDGYFFAADIGGDIKGNHIDVFLGLEAINPFPFVRSTSQSPCSLYVIPSSALHATIKALHGR